MSGIAFSIGDKKWTKKPDILAQSSIDFEAPEHNLRFSFSQR